MAKKKELNEVKEVVKAPVLRDVEEITPETDIRPFVINFGKSVLSINEIYCYLNPDVSDHALTYELIGILRARFDENSDIQEEKQFLLTIQ